MQNNPAAVYRHYKTDLDRYAQRLQAKEVSFVKGRGYEIPQYLIDYGALGMWSNKEIVTQSSSDSGPWILFRNFGSVPTASNRFRRNWTN